MYTQAIDQCIDQLKASVVRRGETIIVILFSLGKVSNNFTLSMEEGKQLPIYYYLSASGSTEYESCCHYYIYIIKQKEIQSNPTQTKQKTALTNSSAY